MFGNNNGNNTGMYMPVAPAYGYGGGYGGDGLFGGGGIWALIFLIAVLNGGWGGLGGFGWGGMGMMGMGMMDGLGLYPWLNNSQHISDGFRDQQLQTSVGTLQQGVTSGFGDVQLGIAGLGRQICETGNGITGAVRDGFSDAEIAANNRQMANMQQLFGIQSAQQQCCCENRAATADLKYTMATEAAATRAAGTADTQRILDKLCQLELDNERAQRAADQREIARLNSELMYARGQASQIDQTAQIRAGQATTANQLVSELRSCPIPSYSVYGNQPVFTCAGPTVGNSCGCGGNPFGFAA